MTPIMFMEKLQWLFNETEWKKRSLDGDKLYFKIVHESDDYWRGVLYENVDDSSDFFVKIFEYLNEGGVTKSSSFFGRLFN